MRSIINMMSMKSKFAVLLLLMIVAMIVAVAASSASRMRAMIEQEVNALLHGNATLVISVFDAVRGYTTGILNTAALTPQVQAVVHHEGGQAEANAMLYTLYRGMNFAAGAYRTYENILVFDANLNLVAYARPSYITNASNIAALEPSIREARRGEQCMSSVIISSQTSNMQFWYTQPIMNGDVFMGMVAVVTNIQALTYFLQSDIAGQFTYFTNLVDNQGIIFYSSRPAYVGMTAYDLGVEQTFGYTPMNTMFQHDSWITGVTKIAYVTTDERLDWTIISFFDAHTMTPIGQTIFISLLPAVGAILITAAFIFWVVSRGLKPLGNLAKTAELVARGNTDVNFYVNREDEVGRVSKAFLAIVKNLKKMKNHLDGAEAAIGTGYVFHRMEDEELTGAFDTMLSDVNSITKKMANYLDFMPAPIIIIGQDNMVRYTNKTVRDLTEIRAAVIREGKHINEVLNADIAKDPAVVKCLREGVAASREMQMRFSSSKLYDIALKATPIKDNTDAVVGAFLLFTDVTELKETSRLAEKLNICRKEQMVKLTNAIAQAFEEGNLSLEYTRSEHDADTEAIVEEFDKTSLTLRESIGAVKGYVSELHNTLGDMSRKDFTGGITRRYEGDFIAIKDSVNIIFKNMNQFFSEISTSSSQVRDGVSVIATTANNMASTFTQQRDLATRINVRVKEITEDINKNLGNTQEATQISSAAKDDAQQGSIRMADMLTAMEEIRGSYQALSNIIQTINDISFQTNLLALNASVEAARAGEHGRGFAVVAEEVRNLATRSAKAARDSTEMINASMQKVDIGVEIAESTSSALAKVVNAVDDIDQAVTKIAQASTRQTHSIGRIESNVQDIDTMTQNNASVILQNATTAQELEGQADILQEMIAEFILRE